jgi:hypothetical protein
MVVNIELGLLASEPKTVAGSCESEDWIIGLLASELKTVAGFCESEDWIIGLLQNVALYSPNDTASHSRRR